MYTIFFFHEIVILKFSAKKYRQNEMRCKQRFTKFFREIVIKNFLRKNRQNERSSALFNKISRIIFKIWLEWNYEIAI